MRGTGRCGASREAGATATRSTPPTLGSLGGGRGRPRRLTVTALVLMGLVFALTGCMPTPSIAGAVTDLNGGPARGTEVAVYDDGSETLVTRTYTDANGKYEIAGLASGSYRVRMSDAAWYQDATSWEAATSLPVSADQTTTVDASISLAVGGLSGTASLRDGQAGAWVSVTAYNAETGDAIESTITDGGGAYSFASLASAPYRVRFSGSGLGAVYAGGAVTKAASAIAVVTTGEVTTGVDATLDAQATLSGRVANGDSGVGGLAVRLMMGDELVAGTNTNTDGSFVVPGLPAATYRVQVRAPSGKYRNEYWGTTGLTTPEASPAFTLEAGQSVDAGTNLVAGADCDPGVFFPAAHLAGLDLRAAALAGCQLAGADLTGAQLDGADLTGADLTGARLSDAHLADGILTGARLASADVTGASIRGADLRRTTGLPSAIGLVSTAANGWAGTDFFDSDLSLAGADLAATDLSGVVMGTVNPLVGPTLAGADLTGALLSGVNLRETDLTGADLTNASLPSAIDTPIGFDDAQFDNTLCPTFNNSDDVGGTCGGEPWMCAPPSCLPADHCPSIGATDAWGAVLREPVTYPGHLDAVLGTVFRPADTATHPGVRPVVAILPGYNQTECYQWWAA